MNREWKVLKNGVLWTDRFDSEDSAIEYAEIEKKNNSDYEFTVEEMTQDEIDSYYNY